ncbi:MAG: RsmG family class I SAM-dependent methyltransferase [Actinomycetota bacterium]
MAHAAAVAGASDRLGLVAPGDRGSMVARHTADSLLFALARPPIPGETWVDVGSGAGFPGLVLACCYPETRFTLIEPSERRAGFLELQLAGLGLANVEVVARRLEDVSGAFDIGVARAFQAPSLALRSMITLVKVGGRVIVAAGPHEAVPAGATAVTLERLGDVDSPGVLFMMSREV